MTRLTLALLLGVSLIEFAGIVSSAASENPVPFSVGVLRQDGGLIPIGTYTGRRWQRPWPGEAITDVEIPLTLSAVPPAWWGKPGPPDRWQVWSDGRQLTTIHSTSPAILPVECSSRLALQTDYRSRDPAPGASVQPYPKVGLAVSPAAQVNRIAVLDSSSAEWTAIGPALRPAFDEAEEALAINWVRAGDPHPIPRDERRRTPIAIEAMYASGEGSDRTYFVEAVRKYDHSRDERALCAVAFGGGFFQHEGNGVRQVGMDMRVVPCDRQGIVYMLPLGAVRLRDKTFWIAQFSSWDFEQYEIVEFKRPHVEIAVATFGGRC